MRGRALKDLIESKGPDKFLGFLGHALEKGDVDVDHDFSIREIYQVCQELQEAEGGGLTTGMFPKITGALIAKKLIDAYNLTAGIGDRLVTNMPSKLKIETIVGFNAMGDVLPVEEGGDYKETGFNEKYVTTRTKKYGRLISISEEAVYFDQTGQVLLRAQAAGERAKAYREKIIIEGVIDRYANVYRPGDAAAALYSAALLSLETSNRFSENALETVKTNLSNKVDEASTPIIMPAEKPILLCDDPVEIDAWKLSMSVLTPDQINATNYWRAKFDVLTSPYLVSTTDWWYGWFKKQFVWQDIWPLQVVRLKSDHLQFAKDVFASFKVRFYGGIASIDYRYVVKSTA